MRLLFHLSGLSVASGKDREMKTPKEFDYDLWIAEDGRYMVRVKATREECAVSQAVFRKLRAEEKKLRREMDMHKSPRPCIEDSPAKVRLVSLAGSRSGEGNTESPKRVLMIGWTVKAKIDSLNNVMPLSLLSDTISCC